MTALRIGVAVLGLALLGAIIWATLNTGSSTLHGSFFQQGEVILSIPWGFVAMVDLYVGFAFFALVVFLAERSWISAIAWSVPIFFLGNIVVAAWLVVRMPSLISRLNRPDWPGDNRG
jgi:hypothetical protein